jgi:tetratricopeptide (TPR) repeat protein
MTLKNNRALLCAVGVAACVLGLCAIAAASPQSHQLVLMGHADLNAGNYAESLKKFDAAIRADPNDGEALYFEGAALNRLGRFNEALARLEKAFSLGFKGPGLSFDTGWALLRLGRWIDAVVQLEQFERLFPGRAKTSEFLGQAYLGLKQYDRAEAKLIETIQRDADVKPTALLHLAMLERERKNPATAERYLETLQKEAPDSPIAQTLRTQMERRAGAEKK